MSRAGALENAQRRDLLVGGRDAAGAVRPHALLAPDDWTVEMHVGEPAAALLRDESFLGAWRGLIAGDPKSTRFQQPDFALPWYDAYRQQFQPALVVARALTGDLVGLMALAVGGHGVVVHVGANTAWYHGWTCLPEVEGEFPRRAVARVFETLPVRRWRWRYLPPGAPTGWLSDLGPDGPAAVRTRTFATSIWDLSDIEELERRTTKGRVRNYANRYRQRGTLVFERLTDPVASAAALNQLAEWANFRQGALHGDYPYRDDPYKMPFHLAGVLSSEQVVLHALRLDDRFLAVHVGDVEGDRFFMGMQGHDPAESRLSPGTILLYELAIELAGSGVGTIDFTPGGEPWKARYATAEETAVQPEFIRSRLAAAAESSSDALRAAVKRAFAALDLDPRQELSKARAFVRGWGQRLTPAPAAPRSRLFEMPAPPGNSTPLATPGTAVADLLGLAHRREGPAGTRLLNASLSCLGAGWQPVIGRHADAAESVAWLQPDDARVQLPEAGESPRLVRGKAPAERPAAEAPEGVSVLWVTHLPEQVGEAEAALERLLGVASAELVTASADAPHTLWVLLDGGLDPSVRLPNLARELDTTS